MRRKHFAGDQDGSSRRIFQLKNAPISLVQLAQARFPRAKSAPTKNLSFSLDFPGSHGSLICFIHDDLLNNPSSHHVLHDSHWRLDLDNVRSYFSDESLRSDSPRNESSEAKNKTSPEDADNNISDRSSAIWTNGCSTLLRPGFPTKAPIHTYLPPPPAFPAGRLKIPRRAEKKEQRKKSRPGGE